MMTMNLSRLHWRWIDDVPRVGAVQMALDELFALRGEPVFRFYDWLPATVSLGFHQRANRLDFDKLSSLGLGVCRRPTGGRAVVHDQVLTYSVTAPLDEEGKPALWELYQWIGELWLDTLLGFDIPVELVEEPLARPGANFDGCFASGNRFELACRGRKLLGSAQRRYPKTALQHGSLRLAFPRIRASELFIDVNKNEPLEETVATTLEEECGRLVSAQAIQDWMYGVVSSAGYQLERSQITEEELAEASRMAERFTVRAKQTVEVG
ncbi:MAG: lipoate--protein ligase family protein [bacterium]|nr:lipoate--protein ligase family protein [bacterium]